MNSADRSARQIMEAQLSLITLAQARGTGLTSRQVAQRVHTGTWRPYQPGVFGLAGAPASPEVALLAACLAAGPVAAASHLSAAWILGLVERPPARPVITVPYQRRPRLHHVRVHRSRDLDPERVLVRRGIPYTDGLRCICDLAAEMEPERGDELDRIMDRALAGRMVTTEGLGDEFRRRARPGRQGPAGLRSALQRRGLIGGPAPSVLEAETMRLFGRFGIPVLGCEVRAGLDGRYRLDFLIAPGLAVEVDGYAFHWSPEAKAYDDTRRNHLRLSGITVLVYSWRDIRFDGRRVVAEIRSAERARRALGPGA